MPGGSSFKIMTSVDKEKPRESIHKSDAEGIALKVDSSSQREQGETGLEKANLT